MQSKVLGVQTDIFSVMVDLVMISLMRYAAHLPHISKYTDDSMYVKDHNLKNKHLNHYHKINNVLLAYIISEFTAI